MLEIERANFVIWLVKRLLFIDKKILAIAAVRKLYDCSIADAKRLVESLSLCAEREFIKCIADFIKHDENEEEKEQE